MNRANGPLHVGQWSLFLFLSTVDHEGRREEGNMTSREVLRCRIYVAEDAMYRRIGELDGRLHELESRLKDLTRAVHGALCTGGSRPLEVKTGTILQAVEAFEAGLDLVEIKALAERITSLKGLIDAYEGEVEECPASATTSSEDRQVREVFAAAG
jgi:hypothetical protein